MSKVFLFNPGQGELKDQVSGTVPTNTNVLVKNTENGRAAVFDSTSNLEYARSTNQDIGDTCTLVYEFKVNAPLVGAAINYELSSNESFQNYGWIVRVQDGNGTVAGKIDFRTSQSGAYTSWGSTNKVVKPYTNHQLIITKNGTSIVAYLDNVEIAGSGAVSNSVASSIGLFVGGQGSQKFIGNVSKNRKYNHVFTTAEREALYQEFLHSYPQQNALTNFGGMRPVGNFDGVDDVIIVTDDAAIQNIFDGGGTVFAWINPRSDGETDNGRILGKGIWVLSGRGEAAGKLEIQYLSTFSGDNGVWRTTSTEADINKFSSVAVTYDADSVSNAPAIYVNNSSVALTEVTPPTGTRTTDVGANITIGESQAGTRAFDGQIANTLLYNEILTTAELTQLHNGIIVRRGLVGKWGINEGSGTVIYDTSGNDNHGTLTNALGAAFWQQTKQLRSDLPLFYDNGLNWNADSVIQADHLAGYTIDSGTFRVKEDATGKYIDCVTNGTITFEGVNLGDLVGNGYIKTLTGDLSGDSGDTVDNASNVAWILDKLTLTMTAGQVLRNILITRGS